MAHADLNLVRTFVLLYETRSVTLTAQRLFVTQPSVSYALSRLREQFDDRLFVRGRNGMEPTVTARQLYPALRDGLQQLEATLASGRDFNPASCTRRFRLALTDLGEMSLLPRILPRLHAEAPGIELEVVALEIDRASDWLASGKVNAVICSRPLNAADVDRRALFEDRYVCLSDPQALGGEPLDLARFSAGRHVVVASASGHDLADEVMRRDGIERKVSLEIPHFSVLPQILQGSDLLAILPAQIASDFAARSSLVVSELPFPVPPFEVALYYQTGAERAPAQRWFYEGIVAAIGDQHA
ncbi:DNA-binding transcriptional regulator, LysR family [Franzmannia pantelleriensis]|uniref:DNA-binding transcriptional regulator, LysR family n=1 Tax=Franzmannia pantelleriensis TaxID=48727 RepID=A0A1G9SJZ7_9GAMM|nr:LysR family transcriptional regulator [Halomonas pantelleriensis]SDM35813.1 DNA-binding transcriptional regulator, LysR family [Halomonas pantelleriensis]